MNELQNKSKNTYRDLIASLIDYTKNSASFSKVIIQNKIQLLKDNIEEESQYNIYLTEQYNKLYGDKMKERTSEYEKYLEERKKLRDKYLETKNKFDLDLWLRYKNSEMSIESREKIFTIYFNPTDL